MRVRSKDRRAQGQRKPGVEKKEPARQRDSKHGARWERRQVVEVRLGWKSWAGYLQTYCVRTIETSIWASAPQKRSVPD